MFNEDLNTLKVFADAHDKPGKFFGQLLLDTAGGLPIILKCRCLDYLDKLGFLAVISTLISNVVYRQTTVLLT